MDFETGSIRKKTAFKKRSSTGDNEEAGSPGNPATAGLLNLQRTMGNQGVLQQLNGPGQMGTLNAIGLGGFLGSNQAVQRQVGAAAKKKSFVPDDAPTWAVEDLAVIKAMQNELKRLGLYSLLADGDYGPGTDAALVEAFGGDKFRKMPKEDVLTLLKGAKPTAQGKKGERTFRYGEMFKDGLLDITLGVGFQEAAEAWGDPLIWQKDLEQTLGGLGFIVDANVAELLYASAGRALSKADFGIYYVKKNALTYQPPIGPARQINAVVRVVSGADATHGKEAAEAFEQGMVESDVAFYAGHGRYGSGMDFDRNFEKFILKDKTGTPTEDIIDYHDLGSRMKEEGKPFGRSDWEQFLWRHAHNRIEVVFSNEANIYMNKKDRHSNEFGARLIYWALEQTGKKLAMGKDSELGTMATAQPEHKYRINVFNGCNTRDYLENYRATPGFDEKSAEAIGSRRVLLVTDIANTLGSFLDSVMKQQSAQETIEGMESQQNKDKKSGPAFLEEGTKYDPQVR